MTQKNRETAYKNFRNLENTYEALPHLDKGMTSTQNTKARAKKYADALLLRNPELEIKPEILSEDNKPKPEVKKEKVKNGRQ